MNEKSISGLRNVENNLSINGNTIEGSLVADQNPELRVCF